MSKKTESYQCKYCNKTYKKESTVLSHKCVNRDRYESRNTRQMDEAYRLWFNFMQINKFPIKKSEEPFMVFIKSSLFNTFYKFADYTINTYILDKDDFINDLFAEGVSYYDWESYKTKKSWVIKQTRRESPRNAIERAIVAMQEWSSLTGNDWTDFFNYATSERVILWVESGKLSPWIFYIFDKETGDKLLSKFSNSDFDYIAEYIDPRAWQPLQIRYKKDVEEIRKILKDYDL